MFFFIAISFMAIGQIMGFSQLSDVYALYGAAGIGTTMLFCILILGLMLAWFGSDFRDKYYIFGIVGLLNYIIFNIFVNSSISARYYEAFMVFLIFYLVSKNSYKSMIILFLFIILYLGFSFSVKDLRSVYNVENTILYYIF